MAPPNPLPAEADAGMLPTHEAVRRTLVAVASAGAVLTLVALSGWGGRAGLSAALGSALAVGNLWGLARVVMALLGQSQTTAAGWGVLGLLKLMALFGAAWGLFRAGVVDVLPFVAGYAALPLGITIGSMFLGAPAAAAAAGAAHTSNEPADPPSPGAGQA